MSHLGLIGVSLMLTTFSIKDVERDFSIHDIVLTYDRTVPYRSEVDIRVPQIVYFGLRSEKKPTEYKEVSVRLGDVLR